MTKAKFTISNSIVNNMEDKVSDLESKEVFNLKSIDIEKIIPNPKNFYAIENIEDLANEIEADGFLLSNLVVKPIPDDKYMIISGERRYRAILLLIDRGNLRFKKVPCQVIEVNDLDEEILLIQANAKARELSEVEKLKQVERLTALYKAKKESGEKVPGRTREIIAQDLDLSTTQVGRYEAINRGLIAPLKQLIEENKLSISNASEFATLPENMQMKVYEFLKESSDLTKSEAITLKKELQQKEKELADNKKSLDDIEKQISKYEERSKAALNEVETLKKEKEQLENEINNKDDNESSDIINEVELLKSKLAEAEKKYKDTQEELNKLNSGISNPKGLEENAELVVKLKEIRNSLSSLKFRVSSISKSKGISITPEVISTYKSIKNDFTQFVYDMDKCLLEGKE